MPKTIFSIALFIAVNSSSCAVVPRCQKNADCGTLSRCVDNRCHAPSEPGKDCVLVGSTQNQTKKQTEISIKCGDKTTIINIPFGEKGDVGKNGQSCSFLTEPILDSEKEEVGRNITITCGAKKEKIAFYHARQTRKVARRYHTGYRPFCIDDYTPPVKGCTKPADSTKPTIYQDPKPPTVLYTKRHTKTELWVHYYNSFGASFFPNKSPQKGCYCPPSAPLVGVFWINERRC